MPKTKAQTAKRVKQLTEQGRFELINVAVEDTVFPLRKNQCDELTKWAAGKNFDSDWLVVDSHGPVYFQSMKDERMNLVLHDSAWDTEQKVVCSPKRKQSDKETVNKRAKCTPAESGLVALLKRVVSLAKEKHGIVVASDNDDGGEDFYLRPGADEETMKMLSEIPLSLPDCLRELLPYCNGGKLWDVNLPVISTGDHQCGGIKDMHDYLSKDSDFMTKANAYPIATVDADFCWKVMDPATGEIWMFDMEGSSVHREGSLSAQLGRLEQQLKDGEEPQGCPDDIEADYDEQFDYFSELGDEDPDSDDEGPSFEMDFVANVLKFAFPH